MKRRFGSVVLELVALGLVLAVLSLSATAKPATRSWAAVYGKDYSSVRGFNYTPAEARGYLGEWDDYDHAIVDRDLDYAERLKLNMARVFLAYGSWEKNPAAFRMHMRDFVRTARKHGIGTMFVLVDMPFMMMPDLFEESAKPKLKAWAEDLYRAVGREPGMAVWDVANEPDLINDRMPAHTLQDKRMAVAKFMAMAMKRIDKRTPVTIGCLFLTCTVETAGLVDVLSYHDYSQTRLQIRADIRRGQQFAARMEKPIITTEMGCIARGDSYDVEIEEHTNARMGWMIWELMITPWWGPVHGVVYPDGTVRDPSVAAAILGFYRARGAGVVPEEVDREGWATRAVADARKWLASSDPDWFSGLETAELEANLLESGQLVALHDLPTRKVALLRRTSSDFPALHRLMEELTTQLVPFAVPGEKSADPPYVPAVPH